MVTKRYTPKASPQVAAVLIYICTLVAIVTVSIGSYKCVLQLTWDTFNHDMFNAFLSQNTIICKRQIVLMVQDISVLFTRVYIIADPLNRKGNKIK